MLVRSPTGPVHCKWYKSGFRPSQIAGISNMYLLKLPCGKPWPSLPFPPCPLAISNCSSRFERLLLMLVRSPTWPVNCKWNRSGFRPSQIACSESDEITVSGPLWRVSLQMVKEWCLNGQKMVTGRSATI